MEGEEGGGGRGAMGRLGVGTCQTFPDGVAYQQKLFHSIDW